MSRDVRVIVPHDAALNDYHEWICVEPPVYVDSLLRQRSDAWRRAMRWRCNNTDCPAVALVAYDAIAALLPALPENGGDTDG